MDIKRHISERSKIWMFVVQRQELMTNERSTLEKLMSRR